MKPMSDIQKTIYDLALLGLHTKQIQEFLEKQDIGASQKRILEILALARAQRELHVQIALAKVEAITAGPYRTYGGPFTELAGSSHPSRIAPLGRRPAQRTGS